MSRDPMQQESSTGFVACGGNEEEGRRTRFAVYGLLIVLSVAGILSRIATVHSKSGRTPMLSANDRSRWAAVRAMGDQGVPHVDGVFFTAAGKRDPEWASIDAVKHRGPDGREHWYSSKPTLLTTLAVGPYWVLRQVTGITLTEKPFYVIRILLVVFNVLPLLAYFAGVVWLCERWAATDFARVLTLAAAAGGTYLTTFATTWSNHVPAAISLLGTVVVASILWDQRAAPRGIWYAIAGLLAAFTAANELPALSFFCVVAALLAYLSPRWTVLGFAPAAALVALAAIGTNYWVHGTWSTPYAHRNDGAVVATLSAADASRLSEGQVAGWQGIFSRAGLTLSDSAQFTRRPADRGWVLWDPGSQSRWAVKGTEIRLWNNWYEYDNSYWVPGKPQGVDRGEPSQGTYAFHALLGHHGVLSLTPLWFLSIVGGWCWLRYGRGDQRAFAAATWLLTAVCLAFYLFLRPLEDRNYGGVSCCFRWTLWLIPLWLGCLPPALDRMACCRWCRLLALALLLISGFSAGYNSHNPWSHPWLFDYWTHLGWIRY